MDRTREMQESDSFGYLSVHYSIKLTDLRLALTEYQVYKDLICEIQVRTILQHAWAEIEHDIQYKSAVDITQEIRRRFVNLAGTLETADREFQNIRDEQNRIKSEIEEKIERDTVDDLTISADSVKLFIEKKFGVDYRVSDWTYSWIAKLILSLGISSIEQLNMVIAESYDNALLYQFMWSVRPSPPTIVEDILFLHFKEDFIKKHPLGNQQWFKEYRYQLIKNIEQYKNMERL